MKKGKRKPGSGKRSRFNLSARAELILAAVGVLIIAGVLFLGWGLVSPRLFPKDDADQRRERTLQQENDTRWKALLDQGTVLKTDTERQDVYVDAAKWNALLPTEKQFAAAAACARFKWRRCFVYDPSGAQIGWYIEGDGYHSANAGRSEK